MNRQTGKPAPGLTLVAVPIGAARDITLHALDVLREADVLAAEDTRFGVNGVNIGLFCSTPMVALSRNIPRKQAFEMLTTGDFIPASRAAELGLINRAVPADQLENETQALAEKIAAKLGTAVRHGKGAFYEQLSLPTAEAYAFTGEVMVRNMLEADTAEGINAFLEKRSPDWSQ